MKSLIIIIIIQDPSYKYHKIKDHLTNTLHLTIIIVQHDMMISL